MSLDVVYGFTSFPAVLKRSFAPPATLSGLQVLAHGEDGVQRPVCAYVRPLRLGRSLSSAREAARWISLLARREDQVPPPPPSLRWEAPRGNGVAEAVSLPALPQVDAAIFGGTSRPAEAWSSLHTVLVTRSASKEDRAALLCRLLLGCAPSPCREASELGDDVRHLDGGTEGRERKGRRFDV